MKIVILGVFLRKSNLQPILNFESKFSMQKYCLSIDFQDAIELISIFNKQETSELHHIAFVEKIVLNAPKHISKISILFNEDGKIISYIKSSVWSCTRSKRVSVAEGIILAMYYGLDIQIKNSMLERLEKVNEKDLQKLFMGMSASIFAVKQEKERSCDTLLFELVPESQLFM